MPLFFLATASNKYMEIHTFFIHLLAILLVARIFAEVAVRLEFPPVIGEILAGIFLGPSLLGFVTINEPIQLLAEFGIILLLFEVGLKTNIRRLGQTGGKSFLVATGGFILPLLFGFFLSYYIFGLSLLVSLFVGGTVTATSIGITMRVLMDLKRDQSTEGQVVLGAAVIDDIFGVVLLALLYEFAMGGGVSLFNAGKIITFACIFFAVAPIAAKLISLIIKHFEETSGIPGLLPTTVVSLVLFFAWVAHMTGVPMILGGFAAGLALSRNFFLPFAMFDHSDLHFCRKVEHQMKPIIQLFTPIFFVLVGLSLRLQEIEWSSLFVWQFSLALFILSVIGKILGSMLISEEWLLRWAVGVSMVPRGEVGLIFAEMGRRGEIFSNEIYAGMIFVIAMTTLFPPFILRWFYKRFENRLQFDSDTYR